MTRTGVDCRRGRRCVPEDLGQAIYCLVHHSMLPAKQIAERLGVSYTYLLDAANPDRDEHQFQARWILPATLLAGNFVILDYLERQTGRVAIALPPAAPGTRDLFEATADVCQSLGATTNTIRDALADGRVTKGEGEAVRDRVHRLQSDAARLEALVLAQVERQEDAS